MAVLDAEDSFTNYLKNKGIVLTPSFEETVFYYDVNETKALEQLKAIGEFHTNTMGYKTIVERNFENRTGKLVEQYKFYLKKAKRFYKLLSEKGAENEFERLFLACGGNFISSAEMALKDVSSSGYIDIIKRSMRRGEICLENTDFSNIRKRDRLEVVNINNCSYNMIEIDAFNFLSKLRRKNVKLNYGYLVEQFCVYEGLDENSDEFIMALLRYPYNFMRCCNRYKDSKKNWTIEEYVMRMNRAMSKDEEVFL